MGDQGNIKGYFGAPVKQLKRKAIHSAESTAVNEKKTKSDNPTVRVRTFQGILEGHLPVASTRCEPRCGVLFHIICRRHSATANLQSSLNIGCESGGKCCIDSLVHHSTSNQLSQRFRVVTLHIKRIKKTL